MARSWSAALLSAVVLGAAACGPETTSTPSSRPSSLVAFAPCGDVEVPPDVEAEPRHKFCAQIEFVQADRTTTRTLQLLLISDQASSPLENRRLLVYHPGGPGISAVRLTGQDPPDVDLSRFVVLTWDGTTASTVPGTCGQASLAFGTNRDREGLAARAAEVTAECTVAFGGLADVGAAGAAAELEAIRRALEIETIDLLMLSYGTAIGEAYLGAHGSSVDRAVLDAPIAMEVPWSERVPAVGQALADGATALAASCATLRCTLLGAGAPLTMGAIRRAVLAVAPTVGGGQAKFTATMFDQAVVLSLRSEAYWATWSNAIDDALGGDGTDLWALGEKEYFDLDRAVFYRSLCADIYRPRDFAAFAAPIDDLLFAWTSSLAPCAGFPRRPRAPLTGVEANVLVIASQRDVLAPASLLEVAPELHALGTVCITDVAGHTSYRDPAVETLVHAFLEEGREPDSTACVAT